MKLISLTILDRTETHIIAELEYSVFNLFCGEKKLKRKVYRDIKNGFGNYWMYLDTDKIVFELSSSINAILSTNKETYEI